MQIQSKYLEYLATKCVIGIGSTKNKATCNLSHDTYDVEIGGYGSGVNAVTVNITSFYNVDGKKIDAHKGSLIVLHIEMLEALLRTDLTASERLAQQNLVAILVRRAPNSWVTWLMEIYSWFMRRWYYRIPSS